MDDLVTRLRDRAYSGKSVDALCECAALEIEWLRDVVMLKLDAALRNGAAEGRETAPLWSNPSGYTAGVSAATETKNHDAAPAARAQVDAAGISRQGTGNTPVTEPIPKEKLAEVSDKPCPYVTGTVTRHCTLNTSEKPNSSTLTDAEREAIKVAARDYGDNDMDAGCWRIAYTLRGLLERMK